MLIKNIWRTFSYIFYVFSYIFFISCIFYLFSYFLYIFIYFHIFFQGHFWHRRGPAAGRHRPVPHAPGHGGEEHLCCVGQVREDDDEGERLVSNFSDKFFRFKFFRPFSYKIFFTNCYFFKGKVRNEIIVHKLT